MEETLEDMLTAHSELVKVSAESYANFLSAQDTHRANRDRERHSYEAIAMILTKMIEDNLEGVDQRYNPVGFDG